MTSLVHQALSCIFCCKNEILQRKATTRMTQLKKEDWVKAEIKKALEARQATEAKEEAVPDGCEVHFLRQTK